MRSETANISLSAPQDVIGVVPAMLGFHPVESVVVIGVEGPRRRSCFTMRADLPPAAAPAPDFCRQIAERVATAGADGSIVVVYAEVSPRNLSPRNMESGGVVRADLPYADFAMTLGEALRRVGVACLDLLLTGGGRIWSYSCRDLACCPAEGLSVPASLTPAAARLHAEVIGRGGLVWDSRADLVSSVRPPSGDLAAALEPVYRSVSDTLLQRTADVGVDVVRQETADLVETVCRRYADGLGRVTYEEAARISLGLADVLARDDVLAGCGKARRDSLLALCGDLVRYALPPGDGPVCLVLAWVAYQDGNGALAQCALDRSLGADPDAMLGQLLAQAIEMALPPQRLLEARST